MIKRPPVLKLEPLIWFVLIGVMAISWFIFTPAFSFGLLLGSAIGAINVALLKRNLENFFRQDHPKKITVIFHFYVRFAVTALVLYLIVISGIAHVVALLLGLALPVNLLLASVFWRRRELFGPEQKIESPSKTASSP